jgi:hypothetical protein
VTKRFCVLCFYKSIVAKIFTYGEQVPRSSFEMLRFKMSCSK